MILVADTDPFLTMAIWYGFPTGTVVTANSEEDARELLRSHNPRVLICSTRLNVIKYAKHHSRGKIKVIGLDIAGERPFHGHYKLEHVFTVRVSGGVRIALQELVATANDLLA